MPLKPKEKRQFMILGILIGVIAIAAAYFFRDSWLPRPEAGGTAYTPAPRIELPSAKTADELFNRQDFMNLHQFGDIPVQAPPAGANNPFK